MEESPHKGPRPAAFFDFDRTLIDVNSGMLYVRYERRHGRLSFFSYLRMAVWMILYHLSIINMEKAYSRAVGNYRGVKSEELRQHTRAWFDEEVAGRLQPGAQAALEAHREAQHPTVVLTTSSQYVAEAAQDVFGMDASLAAVLDIDDNGLLTGQLSGPLCYGEGKVIRAQAWANDAGVDLDVSYFYSDSYSDLPMLERVGHPRVVNPDFRLRKAAKKRGWPILDWSEAPATSVVAG
jgi:HAD superfamily hydrolase (TIGR01490 family)